MHFSTSDKNARNIDITFNLLHSFFVLQLLFIKPGFHMIATIAGDHMETTLAIVAIGCDHMETRLWKAVDESVWNYFLIFSTHTFVEFYEGVNKSEVLNKGTFSKLLCHFLYLWTSRVYCYQRQQINERSRPTHWLNELRLSSIDPSASISLWKENTRLFRINE